MGCSATVCAAILVAAATLDAREPTKEVLTDVYVPLAVKYTGGDYKDATFNYRLMRPRNVAAGQSYPLIVFLHGAGERGSDNKRQLFYLPEQMAQPEFRETYPCYLLAPQCQSGKQWVDVPWADKKSTPMAKSPSHQMQAAIAMIERTLKDEAVDPDRVYLTGLSMGGYGSWDLAARRPEWFAAVAPICGGGDERQADRLAKIPLWAFHGDADGAVPVGRTRSMIEAIRKAGGKPKYTEFPGVGHNSWNPAYRQKDGVIPWMFQQARKPSPRKPTPRKTASTTNTKRRAPWTTSRIQGTPQSPPPYRIQVAYPGVKFKLPTSLEELPGMNRLMVTEIGGTIYTFPKRKDVKRADPLLELAGNVG
ncbi:MAG: dienelactone hydrolase family protein, partial [Planctomycetota bacterium]|nr:dienelactone hydrolase family protein [Planctomycetota bacterium]